MSDAAAKGGGDALAPGDELDDRGAVGVDGRGAVGLCHAMEAAGGAGSGGSAREQPAARRQRATAARVTAWGRSIVEGDGGVKAARSP
ncbi:MAG: hypothetical protein IT374_27180 [Polyangiaceae bacterium]|nr:hypothetical protein [Polyangiaceae bacterium]